MSFINGLLGGPQGRANLAIAFATAALIGTIGQLLYNRYRPLNDDDHDEDPMRRRYRSLVNIPPGFNIWNLLLNHNKNEARDPMIVHYTVTKLQELILKNVKIVHRLEQLEADAGRLVEETNFKTNAEKYNSADRKELQKLCKEMSAQRDLYKDYALRFEELCHELGGMVRWRRYCDSMQIGVPGFESQVNEVAGNGPGGVPLDADGVEGNEFVGARELQQQSPGHQPSIQLGRVRLPFVVARTTSQI